MASVRENTKNGAVTSWSVLFRQGKKQSSRTFETSKGAQEAAALIDLVGVAKALPLIDGHGPAPDALTVDGLFEKWITWKAESEKKITGRTLKDYRRDYENWIQPTFGKLPADGVNELDVQKWVDKIGTRLEAKTVRDHHALLGGMYRWGKLKTRQLVTYNPCTETQLPERKKKAPKGFKIAEWEAMHAWGKAHEPDADDLLLFAVATGWRWQEGVALLVRGVEDYGDAEFTTAEGRVLVVPQVWVSVDRVVRRDEHDAYVEVEGEAKSEASVRRINLPPAAARMVRRRVVGKGPGDLVFTNSRGGRWHPNNLVEREFQRILDGAGITKVKGMGPHYLRHTHVAMLDRAKVSAAKTQRRIGHKSLEMTFGVYGGMIDNSLSDTELAALDVLVASDDQDARTAVVGGQVVRGELA